MEKMDMDARNKYLGVLRKRYFAACRKKRKHRYLMNTVEIRGKTGNM